MKKVKGLLGALLLLFFVSAVTVPVKAETTDYEIKPDTEVTGVLESAEQKNVYKVKITKDGYFTFNFSCNGADEKAINCGWTITIYDENYYTLWTSSGIKNNIKTSIFDFEKGSIFYIGVEGTYSFTGYGQSPYPLGAPYSVFVEQHEDDTWEKEYNNTKGTATPIYSNKETYATLWEKTDEDYFVYTVQNNGTQNLEFDIKNLNPDAVRDGWKITYYDKNLNMIFQETTKNPYTSKTLNFKKGTKLYISIEADYTVYAPVDVTYTVRMNDKASSAWEVEKNNTFGTATTLSSKKTGSLYLTTDVDYYKFKATKTKTAIKLSHDSSVSAVRDGWCVTIYDKNKKKIASMMDVTGDDMVKFPTKTGEYYYVLVEADYTVYAPLDVVYTLTKSK